MQDTRVTTPLSSPHVLASARAGLKPQGYRTSRLTPSPCRYSLPRWNSDKAGPGGLHFCCSRSASSLD